MSLRVRASLWATSLRAARAEIIVVVALLAGWALLTHGLAVVMWAPLRRGVWPVSSGLALLSLFGWRMLGGLAWGGLYPLLHEDRPAAAQQQHVKPPLEVSRSAQASTASAGGTRG